MTETVSTELPLPPSSLSLWHRIKRLRPYFGQPIQPWVVAITATALSGLTEPLMPLGLQLLLDHGFNPNSPNKIAVWQVPVAILGFFLVRGVAGFVSELAMAQITTGGLARFRHDMFGKVQEAQLDLFRAQSASELANTVVHETHRGANLFVNAIVGFIRDIATLVGLVVYLLMMNWQLTLIVAGMIPVVAVVMVTLTKRLYKLTRATQTATDDLAYVVEENVLAHRDVRLHGAQLEQRNRFQTISSQLRRLWMKSTIASAAMKPLTQLLAAVAISAIVSIALVQSYSGTMSVGAFTSFITAVLLVVAPIKHLSEVSSPLTQGLAGLERGFDLLDHTTDESSGRTPLPRAQGLIEFDKTSVAYADDQKLAVNTLSLRILPGQMVAFVGASGSGKTTLVNLLPRFVNHTSGRVLVDHQPIENWRLTDLRRQIALVSQHVVMFNDSLARNVALGQAIDEAKVRQCLEAAHLGQFVQDLPQGIHTVVGHNANQLSGGQRQRLAIARALYKDAPILILDEATSALDAESERAVQAALAHLMQGRTTLVIAHRLSTVEHADLIVVMAEGKIVETGTHSQLLAEQGTYARLYRMGLHAQA